VILANQRILSLFYLKHFSLYVIGLLWRAPEHLDEKKSLSASQMGDVYSYGIILQEILLRGLPYCMNDFMEAKSTFINFFVLISDILRDISGTHAPEVSYSTYFITM